MARRPDVVCAGGCGKKMWKGSGSLAPGKATCQPCRRRRQAEQGPKPQPGRRRGPDRTPRPNARKGRTCEVCGGTYDASYKEQRTCSRACGLAIRMPREGAPVWPSCSLYVGDCVQCGRLFTNQRKRPTCSAECAQLRKQAYDRVYNTTARPRSQLMPAPCIICQGGSYPFPPRRCPACRAAAKRSEKRRRAALKRGVATERYTLVQIAERDHYYCGLCHKRVAMTKATPHPKAPTIDHVVPLACGGDDTRANVQLAHFICNSRKCTGGVQQLALLG